MSTPSSIKLHLSSSDERSLIRVQEEDGVRDLTGVGESSTVEVYRVSVICHAERLLKGSHGLLLDVDILDVFEVEAGSAHNRCEDDSWEHCADG